VHHSKFWPPMTGSGQSRSFGDVCLMSGLPPESGLKSEVVTCPRCANSDLTHRSKQRPYSIISSVWASNIGEIVRPSAFAVFKLIAT
jgi:hypothetical protein